MVSWCPLHLLLKHCNNAFEDSHTQTHTHIQQGLFMLSEQGHRQDPLCLFPGPQKDIKEHQKAEDNKMWERMQKRKLSWFTVVDRGSEEICEGEKQEGQGANKWKEERGDMTPDSVVVTVIM